MKQCTFSTLHQGINSNDFNQHDDIMTIHSSLRCIDTSQHSMTNYCCNYIANTRQSKTSEYKAGNSGDVIVKLCCWKLNGVIFPSHKIHAHARARAHTHTHTHVHTYAHPTLHTYTHTPHIRTHAHKHTRAHTCTFNHISRRLCYYIHWMEK